MAQTKIDLTNTLPFVELGWLDPTGHRQMIRGGPQVLTDGHNVDPDGSKIGHGRDHFIELLAHADDDRRLRRETGCFGSG